MAQKTAEDVSAKWLSRIQQATTEMQNGVNAVTIAPGQAAAAKQAKWVAAMSDPTIQAKWARNVSSVSLQAWQTAMTSYGINRVASGAQAKQDKFTRAMSSLLPYTYQGVNTVKQMDDTTFEARLQRSTAMQRWMHNYKRPAGA